MAVPASLVRRPLPDTQVNTEPQPIPIRSLSFFDLLNMSSNGPHVQNNRRVVSAWHCSPLVLPSPRSFVPSFQQQYGTTTTTLEVLEWTRRVIPVFSHRRTPSNSIPLLLLFLVVPAGRWKWWWRGPTQRSDRPEN